MRATSETHSPNAPTTPTLARERPRVVVLGAGFAGLNAARQLRNSAVDVVIIDRNNYHLFQPLLYQVATAGLNASEICQPVRGILGRYANIRVLMAQVESVDRAQKTVHLENDALEYDYLIVATGAQVKYFGPPAWRENSTGLKTVEDAQSLRRQILSAFEAAEQSNDPAKIRELLTFVVIGGGPTGVEMAGAIREIAAEVMDRDFRTVNPADAQVILVDALPHILSSYPEDLVRKATKELEKRSIEVLTDARVTDIDARSVHIGEERVIPTRTVVWAAGVEPSPLLKSLDAELDKSGRAVVNADLTLPGSDCEFVLGDAAHFDHDLAEPLPGLAPVAIQQGRYAAKSIKRRVKDKTVEPFEYFDKGQMSTIGRAAAIVEFGRIRAVGFFAWILWLFIHLLYLVGFKNRVVVLIEWTYSYLAFKRGSRIIIGSADEDPQQKQLCELPQTMPDVIEAPTGQKDAARRA